MKKSTKNLQIEQRDWLMKMAIFYAWLYGHRQAVKWNQINWSLIFFFSFFVSLSLSLIPITFINLHKWTNNPTKSTQNNRIPIKNKIKNIKSTEIEPIKIRQNQVTIPKYTVLTAINPILITLDLISRTPQVVLRPL